MNDVIASGGRDGHHAPNSGAATTLRLLVLWLLHCHDRTRRRQQLGVLEPHFRDAGGVDNAAIANARDVPDWH